MNIRTPVSRPSIGKSEFSSVRKALKRGEISGLFGENISDFEERFAEFNGSEFAVACSSGTAALHLALVALGLGPGDEVLVSDTTNMASFFAVLYTGAKPIPVDILPGSMTMDPADLEQKITSRSKAIMPVHLFGQPCDMASILRIANEFNLEVIEDCAEAHGAQFSGKQVGSFGIAGCFSFFANKILTTGEGGMVTTNDSDFAKEMRALRSLNFGDGTSRFFHRGIGFNYRMTNPQAAIGLEQLKRAHWLINSRRDVEAVYRSELKDRSEVVWQSRVSDLASPVTWMAHVILPSEKIREVISVELARVGVETRPGFIPFSLQDEDWANPQGDDFPNPIAKSLAMRTMYLPTWSGMPTRLAKTISSRLIRALEKIG